MSNQSHYLAWINECEIGLAAWIRRYLTKRGKTLPNSLIKGNELGQLKREIERWPTTGPEADTTWRLLRQMKEAWTQQKIRDQRKKSKQKACAFVLSSAAQKNLQRLTNENGHGTAAECLEWLLQNSAAQLKAADKERKETKERHNEELRGKQSHINALGHLVGYALYDLAISSTTIQIDDKKTRQTLAEPQERDIEKAYETVRKNALARAAKLTHLSQKQLAALITRPSNEQIAFSMANILGVEPAQPSELEVGPSNSLELAPLQVEAHKAMTPNLVHPEAQLEEERSIQHDQGCPPDTSSPGNTVELPGEPEAIELSELRRQSNSVAGATFQKRKQPPLAILKPLPQPGLTYEFEGLISMDISEADD
ncbi:hypothetical protein [Pseudomonas protegens]|uniref:hypothetical protein n=1 Tax=Pseudomonas protegens TaxID=380021 RepID=UPI00069DAB06|nr:hypothetical protein [Pseudomonas protegens]